MLLNLNMELTKLFVESYVEFIHYIAWPAAVLIVLVFFRNELKGLIGRFIEYEGPPGIFRFDKTDKQKLLSLEFPEKAKAPSKLSTEAKRILATLWNRQTYHFKDDYSRRWSFRILPAASGYGVFMLGFAELLKSGLVTWTPKDGQAVLTDEGISYVKKYPEIQESEDIYRF